MTIQVGPIQTGTPPKPAVYVVTFQDDPQTEVLSYFDGRSWGHSGHNLVAAMQGLRVGERLPLFKRYWWTRALTWRTYSNNGAALVDAWRDVRG